MHWYGICGTGRRCLFRTGRTQLISYKFIYGKMCPDDGLEQTAEIDVSYIETCYIFIRIRCRK